MSSPFIIFTLQRTGGTNFARYLMSLSDNESAQHEPFNKDRIYGEITENFTNSNDKETLKSSIVKILEKKINIKHCVEIVPFDITSTLIECGDVLNYKFIFLIRENSVDRLLSYAHAKITKNWGKSTNEHMVENDKKVLFEDLPVKQLIQREKLCRNRLQKTWDKCFEKKISNTVVTFEELYYSNLVVFQKKISNIFDFLGMQLSKVDRDVSIEKLRNKGDQGGASKYSNFSGIEKLEKQLSVLKDLEIYSLD